MSSTVADLYDDDLDAFESDLEDARMQADRPRAVFCACAKIKCNCA